MYKILLGVEEQRSIKELWLAGANNTEIARQMIKKYNWNTSVEHCRKRMSHLTRQFAEEAHRGNAINEYAKQENTLPWVIAHAWHKTELPDWSKISTFIRNPNYESELEDVKDAIIEKMQEYAPKYTKIKRTLPKDPHLLVLDPADIHIGKLCSVFETWNEYDVDIAIKRVFEGVEWILQRCSWYTIEKILFVGGNDILHIDTPRRTTTSWTPQDTDWQWHDNFLKAQDLYVKVLETLIAVADVHFVYNPSNHDYTNGFFLANTIKAWFRNNENITFDCNLAHRKYYRYYDNLIGTTHWDWAKQNDLPLLMAHECEYWSECKRRYLYGHHLHHKTGKDYIGVTYETLRSPSATDSRHHRNGYTGVPMGIEWFLHHPNQWQVARFTHFF